jgi:hypothetical protein
MKPRILTTLAGVAGCSAIVLSAATIWLWLTQPLALVDAISEGQAASLASAVLHLLTSAVSALVRYL